MRLKHVKGSKEKIASSPYIILNPEEYKGRYKEIFKNDNPIYVEIGMGKGKFIVENALQNPNINFIGIEKFDSVIVRAVEKLEDIELSNLKLIRYDATNIENIFDHEIDKIYLNFSDPWPKARHENRRLTSKRFLDRYKNICKKQELEIKTDNIDLYNFSKETLLDYGYDILYQTEDLYKDNIPNIPTEYETKFVLKGQKICKIQAINTSLH